MNVVCLSPFRFEMIRVESVVAKMSKLPVKVACAAFCRTSGRAAEEGTMGIGLGKWGKFGDMGSKHSSLDSNGLRTAILRLAPIYSGFLQSRMVGLTNARPYA